MICTRASWINVKFLPKTASFLTNNSYIRIGYISYMPW